jgi:hypothetical protein
MSNDYRTRATMDHESNKLPYEKPKLLMLGDVTELTQAVGMSGKGDGGKGNDKTLP